jgi:hypothetical protein
MIVIWSSLGHPDTRDDSERTCRLISLTSLLLPVAVGPGECGQVLAYLLCSRLANPEFPADTPDTVTSP